MIVSNNFASAPTTSCERRLGARCVMYTVASCITWPLRSWWALIKVDASYQDPYLEYLRWSRHEALVTFLHTFSVRHLLRATSAGNCSRRQRRAGGSGKDHRLSPPRDWTLKNVGMRGSDPIIAYVSRLPAVGPAGESYSRGRGPLWKLLPATASGGRVRQISPTAHSVTVGDGGLIKGKNMFSTIEK